MCLVDPKKRVVKRLLNMTGIRKVFVNRADRQILFRNKDPGEVDLLVEWTPHGDNQPGDIDSFVNVLRKLWRMWPENSENNGQLEVVQPEESLSRVHFKVNGAKTDAGTIVRRIVEGQHRRASSAPPSPRKLESPPPQYDSDDQGRSINEVGYNKDSYGAFEPEYQEPHDARIAGQLQRRQSPAYRSPSPQHPPQQQHYASTPPPSGPSVYSGQFVPQTLRPLPGDDDTPWEIHYSKSAGGRPYWYNPSTGDNTWSPPPGHSYPVEQQTRRTTAPWVPPAMVALGRRSTATGGNTRLVTPPHPQRSGSPARGGSVSPIEVLQHASACSGVAVSELINASDSLGYKRNGNYVSI